MFSSCVTLPSNDMFTSVKFILQHVLLNLHLIKLNLLFLFFFLLSLFTRDTTFQKYNYSHIIHRQKYVASTDEKFKSLLKETSGLSRIIQRSSLFKTFTQLLIVSEDRFSSHYIQTENKHRHTLRLVHEYVTSSRFGRCPYI